MMRSAIRKKQKPKPRKIYTPILGWALTQKDQYRITFLKRTEVLLTFIMLAICSMRLFHLIKDDNSAIRYHQIPFKFQNPELIWRLDRHFLEQKKTPGYYCQLRTTNPKV